MCVSISTIGRLNYNLDAFCRKRIVVTSGSAFYTVIVHTMAQNELYINLNRNNNCSELSSLAL